MSTATTNIFVLGLNDASLRMLRRLPQAARYAFQPLLHHDELRGVEEFPVRDLLQVAQERLESFTGPVDAIVTLLDFPATELVPLLGRRYGTRAPTLEAVLKCNHKYWSRVLQQEVVPECVPPFAVFAPEAEEIADNLGLDYPYWVKPLNAFRSQLGFRVDRAQDLEAVLPQFRDELPRLAEPLEAFMKEAELPPEIAGLGAGIVLAEGLIGGRQCTVEGYVHRGRAHVYGVVDSVRAPNRSSFARYQYPSGLPGRVQHRVSELAIRVLEHLGYDDGCFNVEFFWERRHDQLWLVEINPRLSLSHCELFELVDGQSNAQVMIDLALGRRPSPPTGEGEARCAGKFFIRAFRHGRVQRAPTPDDVARAEAQGPGARISVHVESGIDLDELSNQDSYSYELATVRLGAPNERELLRRFARVSEALDFEIVDQGAAR